VTNCLFSFPIQNLRLTASEPQRQEPAGSIAIVSIRQLPILPWW